MLKGSSSQIQPPPTQMTEKPLSPFKLSKAVQSPNKLRAMKSLPEPDFLSEVEKLDGALKSDIKQCFTFLFSHVVERGAHSQGKANFFLHVAATSLYESYINDLVNGKNHGLKAGTILNKVENTLTMITSALKKPTTNQIQETLLNAQAALTAHYNALVAAINSLATDDKLELQKSQNIHNPKELPITPTKVQRIKNVHPASPSISTPKKLSAKDRKSQALLQPQSLHERMTSAKKNLSSLLEQEDKSLDFIVQPGKPLNPTFIPRALRLNPPKLNSPKLSELATRKPETTTEEKPLLFKKKTS